MSGRFSEIRLLIGQPLADCASNSLGSPFGIGDVKRRPLVVAEIELGEEAVRFILSSKESAMKLSPKLGVHHTTISKIRRGEAWSWLAAAKEG